MKKIRSATVRFDYLNKSFQYNAADVEAKPGRLLIVETEHGLDRGTLDFDIVEEEVEENAQLKKIVRAATAEDLEQIRNNGPKEDAAFKVCEEEIDKAGLKMKLIKARHSFDGTKISFCYTADGRVDFRELVRTLASRLKARIELRQVGVRDEARLLGGLGVCGQTLCCATFLREFHPVSIRMAKDQGLPLNPLKISGVCGRLFCCLKYEHEQYCDARRGLPQVGDIIEFEGREARVLALNVLKENALLEVYDAEKSEKKETPFSTLAGCQRCRRPAAQAEVPQTLDAAEGEEPVDEEPVDEELVDEELVDEELVGEELVGEELVGEEQLKMLEE